MLLFKKKKNYVILVELLLLPAVSNITLSFKPKRNSGIPERKHFILIEPRISLLKTLPLLLTLKMFLFLKHI